MGFFRDLFAPLQPCDICQIGQREPIPGYAGTSDWKFDTLGLNVEFIICGRCRRALEQLKVHQKLPPVAMATLITHRIVTRPSTEAYLGHPKWRVAWLYLLKMQGVVPSSREEAVERITRLEQELVDRLEGIASSMDRIRSFNWRMTKTDVRAMFGPDQALPPHPTLNAFGFGEILFGLPCAMVFYFVQETFRERLARIAISFFDEPPPDETIEVSFRSIFRQLVESIGPPGHTVEEASSEPPEFRMSEMHIWRVDDSILISSFGLRRDGVAEENVGIGLAYGDVTTDPTSKMWSRLKVG